MIYTVTFNPSIDYIVDVKDFQTGVTNRTKSELMLVGGKGINVSTVLMNLGMDTTATGFLGGFMGKEIHRLLAEAEIPCHFVEVAGNSRINIKLKSIDGTEINAAGPEVTEEELEKLLFNLQSCSDGDVIVLSGSICRGVSPRIYARIMEMMQEKNILFAVDATGTLLTDTLPFHPFLIKPNIHELRDLYCRAEISSADEIKEYAAKLQERGARNVLVSMGHKGAALLTENGDYYCLPAMEGEVKNSVGSGDSMVAGFLAGYLQSGDYEIAFKTAVAAGSACAFSDTLPTGEEIKELYQRL